MFSPHLRRIKSQLLGDLVDLHFERRTRLRRTVPAFWSTGRLVGKGSYTLKLVTRHVIRDCLQRARIERARYAVTAIRTTVEVRLKVHRRDRAVVLHAGFDLHQNRVTSTVAIKEIGRASCRERVKK